MKKLFENREFTIEKERVDGINGIAVFFQNKEVKRLVTIYNDDTIFITLNHEKTICIYLKTMKIERV